VVYIAEVTPHRKEPWTSPKRLGAMSEGEEELTGDAEGRAPGVD
jgi:hypothetical protein